jgi:eukaryotic-like serine/threonine-protein kinase
MARPDKSEAVKAWFHAAWEQDSARRSSFLKEQCPDPSVRAEVERLLAERERWEAVKALFASALEQDPARRSSFLKERCADPSVRAEVERLLAADEPSEAAPVVETQSTTHGLSEGEVLAGRFRIVRFIAAGGMGEVYEAEDEELRERVALKIIRAEILAQPNAVARFKREVHLARKVTHANVCRIFDLFRHQGESGKTAYETVFVSMELLHGKTLRERLQAGGCLPVEEARLLVEQMAAALGAAHAVGIVHRDFKPGNVVLVGEPGRWRAVVTDFGLALRSLTSDDSAPLATGPGVWGTPAYMSPEQLEGRPATLASDIYALGLVIYEMVTGARPFQGDTPMAAALKRLREPPVPPGGLRADLGPVWESAILRCLERDPAQRFPSARAVVEALAGGESGLSSSPGVGPETPGREIAAGAVAAGKPWKIAVPVLVVALLVVGGLYYRSRQTKRVGLSKKDTIVLADFGNSTGDAIFDDTLKTALSISLEQSPFLNVLSDSKVRRTLGLMARGADTRLTPDVAREVCQRVGSKAYIAGSIAGLGQQYVVELKAVNCANGDVLVQEQVTASAKEKVLGALGDAAAQLRGALGESLATVQKLNVPLAYATTSSLEALKAYSLGQKAYSEKGATAALDYYQRAVELDPNFAMGFASMGWMYADLAELGRANEYFTKAFELREHASEQERLNITSDYYHHVTGELEKAAQVSEEKIENYPTEYGAYSNLGVVRGQLGQYEKAREVMRQALLLAPDTVTPYENLANFDLALQDFDEARQMVEQAQARKLDNFILHSARYALAFLEADVAAMAGQQQWFAGRLEENEGLALASDTEAYRGHLRKARELTQRAVDSAIHADSKETGAVWLENAALREAAFGNPTDTEQQAAAGLKLYPASQGVQVEAALAFAMAGDAVRAEALEHELSKTFPLDTQMQALWLPAIQAQLALNRQNPAEAVNDLQSVTPVELGQILFVTNLSCLYPTYIRGQAYLALGQGNAAAVEFQKILDHSGIVWNCWTGALAHLGVARANALEAKASQGADADTAGVRAHAAYRDFLTLWKDADPDIPILERAKAEYANLR